MHQAPTGIESRGIVVEKERPILYKNLWLYYTGHHDVYIISHSGDVDHLDVAGGSSIYGQMLRL